MENIIYSHYVSKPMSILLSMGNQLIEGHKYFIMIELFLGQIPYFCLKTSIKKAKNRNRKILQELDHRLLIKAGVN
jgi:6-pyruvoyl-tetrahydropterin synthase